MKQPIAESFSIEDLRARLEKSGKPYLPFLAVPSMRMGLYSLGAGVDDKQSPHDEDEVYYVLKGKATLRVESQEFPAEPGALLFVAAHAAHRFHDIKEPLEVLVFFSASPAKQH